MMIGYIEFDRSSKGAKNGRKHHWRVVFFDGGQRYRRRFIERKDAEAFLRDPAARRLWLVEHAERSYVADNTRLSSQERQQRILETKRRMYRRIVMRSSLSAVYYAERRRKQRIYKAKLRIAQGCIYRPRFNRRVPDWATMGKVVDAASPWLVENITPSQRAFARELFIERLEKGWRRHG
jgi:hypothetical protein